MTKKKRCGWQTECQEDEGKNTWTCYVDLDSGVVRECPFHPSGCERCSDYRKP